MFKSNQPYAIFMEGSMNEDHGKMGFGVMRYTQHPVSCVIDSTQAGKTVLQACGQPFDVPVVVSVKEAHAMGAKILVLGTAPSGGKFPESWVSSIEEGMSLGMSLINGLHDNLEQRFGHLITSNNQKIWDVRIPKISPPIGTAKAADTNNKRVLMVGTDMAVGKMTTGLELYKWLREKGVKASFIATGQIGITVTGKGIPLDAIKIDQAAGAVETVVVAEKESDVVIIEGQGSLLNPGSTATLPLMRGSCPTHLILCHQAGKTHVKKLDYVKIPPLDEFIALNEAVVSVCGSFAKAKTIGVAVNTYGLSEEDAAQVIRDIEKQTGLPATDVIRYGVEKLGNQLI